MPRSSDPQPVRVTKGETYQWCACGRSGEKPFCDGQACGGSVPVPFTAPRNQIVFFCGCGKTKTAPVCDGKSHVR